MIQDIYCILYVIRGMELPNSVDDWTGEFLSTLLREGYDENERFDFKVKVPNDVAKTCCAFANTRGGFMIIGIADSKTDSKERIKGVNNPDEVKRQINQHISKIRPAIPNECYRFKDRNIIVKGKKIVLLQINRSPNRPHQYNYKCYERLPGQNSPMNIEKITSILLQSRKQSLALSMLSKECKQFKKQICMICKLVTIKDLETLISLCPLIKNTSFTHFVYNHAHLYSKEIQEHAWRIVKFVELISRSPPALYEVYKSDLKQQNLQVHEIVAKSEKVIFNSISINQTTQMCSKSGQMQRDQ